MSDLPLVSIVTPSYNQSAYLEQTICSVLEQEYSKLEYFVVDGGSSDDSVEIIRKYAPRLQGWVSEKDSGQADAINKGFAQTSGQVIAWLNSDDFYLPGAVAAAVQALQEHPAWGLVYGDMLAVDRKGDLLNIQRFGEWGLEDLMCYSILGQPAVFMRRDALQQAGFLDTRFHYMLDHHLWLRIASVFPIGHTPRLLAAARFHAGAKNVASAPEFGNDAWEVYRWMQAQPNLAASFHKLEKEILAGVYWINGRYLSEGGRPGEALNAFMHSLAAYSPTALRDWRRILFTLVQLTGGDGLKESYTRRRARRQADELPPELAAYLKTPCKGEGR
ncbi:MAG: glycosyltransferase [Anaerolineaceae bacterium]|nr:glycosyltransferase [Anaerolineaceae bacterium]